MGKEHSDSERGNHLRLYMGYLFSISSKGSFKGTIRLLYLSSSTSWNEK